MTKYVIYNQSIYKIASEDNTQYQLIRNVELFGASGISFIWRKKSECEPVIVLKEDSDIADIICQHFTENQIEDDHGDQSRQVDEAGNLGKDFNPQENRQPHEPSHYQEKENAKEGIEERGQPGQYIQSRHSSHKHDHQSDAPDSPFFHRA